MTSRRVCPSYGLFAICCGYEDADELDHLRSDPAFKLACGRLPDTVRDLCSQPTLSRLENAPRLRDVIRLTYTLVDAWMDSYRQKGKPALRLV
jgi:Transposase DDE domain group 1